MGPWLGGFIGVYFSRSASVLYLLIPSPGTVCCRVTCSFCSFLKGGDFFIGQRAEFKRVGGASPIVAVALSNCLGRWGRSYVGFAVPIYFTKSAGGGNFWRRSSSPTPPGPSGGTETARTSKPQDGASPRGRGCRGGCAFLVFAGYSFWGKSLTQRDAVKQRWQWTHKRYLGRRGGFPPTTR